VLLGTSYMRMVMESLDNHPVLASAAYNAGPGTGAQVAGRRPLEGAVYAETIPFNETRDYVKKVMSNSVYYSALFNGQPQSIKSRLGTIGRASRPIPRPRNCRRIGRLELFPFAVPSSKSGLLIGGSGFVGGWIASRLSERGMR
jgi:hypothetical protein